MKDGGPAFPVPDLAWLNGLGMSLRDWFAGQAIIGLAEINVRATGFDSNLWAKNAYRIADAMLAERGVE